MTFIIMTLAIPVLSAIILCCDYLNVMLNVIILIAVLLSVVAPCRLGT
jgi:hypothetical protein